MPIVRESASCRKFSRRTRRRSTQSVGTCTARTGSISCGTLRGRRARFVPRGTPASRRRGTRALRSGRSLFPSSSSSSSFKLSAGVVESFCFRREWFKRWSFSIQQPLLVGDERYFPNGSQEGGFQNSKIPFAAFSSSSSCERERVCVCVQEDAFFSSLSLFIFVSAKAQRTKAKSKERRRITTQRDVFDVKGVSLLSSPPKKGCLKKRQKHTHKSSTLKKGREVV